MITERENLLGCEVDGCYGASCTECLVFVYDCWYVVKGSGNVNMAYSLDDLNGSIVDGVLDVETISDCDYIYFGDGIWSLEELIELIDL